MHLPSTFLIVSGLAIRGTDKKSSGKLYLPEDEKQSGKFPVLKGAFYRLAGPSMIALWLIFQPPPRAVYRETSVLACW